MAVLKKKVSSTSNDGIIIKKKPGAAAVVNAAAVVSGGGLGFEAADKGVAGKLAEQENFHGDDSVQPCLASAVDDSHSASGDLIDQFVAPEPSNLREIRRADRWNERHLRRCAGAQQFDAGPHQAGWTQSLWRAGKNCSAPSPARW